MPARREAGIDGGSRFVVKTRQNKNRPLGPPRPWGGREAEGGDTQHEEDTPL